VTEALLAAAQTHDVSTNTGGVRYRPPPARQPARVAKRKLLSAEQIVDRMRVSYPALRAAKVDQGLKRLFLAELMTQALNEGMEVVLPEGTNTRMVSRETFSQYKEALSGLTQDNLQEVTARLV
jgi:hypothetical protein